MVDSPHPLTAPLSWHKAFWRALTRIDKSKVNGYGMAARNALAVAIPLAAGIQSGHSLAGVAVASGALNVAFSDGRDPYAHRARRMLLWSFLGAVAVFLGSVTGNYYPLAICTAAVWATIAGLLVSISTRAGDLGLNTLVTLIVYAARGAMSPKGALYAGLLVLGGGLLQTAFALLSWPVTRYGPERRAVGSVFGELARQIKTESSEVLATPLKQPSAEVQDTLSALGRDHSVEGERLRLLFDQADRLRLSIYVVQRLQQELESEESQNGASQGAVALLNDLLEISPKLLQCVADAMLSDRSAASLEELLQRLHEVLENAQQRKNVFGTALAKEFASAVDVVAGQLRVAAQLADHSTTAGAEEFAKHEHAPPLKLQMRSWLATLRANLDIQSSAFRHGIRLAVCVAIADALGRGINVQRNYWLAMTVAVVLKPDFTTTLSRGILRLCGTMTGLLLATLLFHFLPQSALTQLVLVGLFTWFLRHVGGANYGIFSVAISGLIVFLIAATGVSPMEVVTERAVNTAAGGIFALIAYALWPTWERRQVTEVMAQMIDCSREYFHAVMRRFSQDGEDVERALNSTRDQWRQARSNAEASVDRVVSEPGSSVSRLDCLTSMLASSRLVMYAVTGLEATAAQRKPSPLPASFETFTHDIEFTLYFLAAALRGSAGAAQSLPKLRDDYRQLIDAGEGFPAMDKFITDEADRLIVSVNTLREQVMRVAGN